MTIPQKYLNQITHGDCRELCKELPDHSIDIIYTDPPYKEIHLYEWLSKESSRLLKDTGFLLSYVGPYHKSTIIHLFDEYLEYFWDYIEVNNTGNSTIIWPRKTIAKYKSILCYRKKGSEALPQTNVLGIWSSGGPAKQYHKWGQNDDTARYYLDVFTQKGMIVLDPFCGGGTTPFACKLLGLNYIAFEIDEESVEISRERVEKLSYQVDMFGGYGKVTV